MRLLLFVLTTYCLAVVRSSGGDEHQHRRLADVTSLKLIKVSDGTVIETLISGISKFAIPTGGVSVRADTNGAVGSIVFNLDGAEQIENIAPYSLCGDSGGKVLPCTNLSVGKHTLTATPYSLVGGSGQVSGKGITITFEVLGSQPTPNPPPPPPPGPGEKVTGFKLIYSPTNAEIFDLFDGAVVNVNTLPGVTANAFNVKAEVTSGVVSVLFSGGQIESSKPFAYCGDQAGKYNVCPASKLPIGSKVTITATPQPAGATPLSMTITLVTSGSPPPPTPTTPPPPPTTPPPPPTPPTAPPPTAPPPGNTVRINCGGPAYTDTQGNVWAADSFFTGGTAYSVPPTPIANTVDDELYISERYGPFTYAIPIKTTADYQIVLHFAEIFFTQPGERVFDMTVEGISVPNIDIVAQGGMKSAFTREVVAVIADGILNISVKSTVNNAKLSAIEVKEVAPHLAHSVPGFSYTAVDSDNNGSEAVTVDGSQSHTHGPGLELTQWIWQEGSKVLAQTVVATFTLNVGVHEITLKVVDNGGNESIETTTITVFAGGFPDIISLSPNKGPQAGGTQVTISGSSLGQATSVKFGPKTVTAITVVNQNTIQVIAPSSSVSAPVQVSVVTPKGESNSKTYSYQGSVPIGFGTPAKVLDFASPASLAFGPDEKLYIGNKNGQIGKFTFNSDFTAITASVISTVSAGRHILGLAFDPLDTSPNPSVYFSSSKLFHGEDRNSMGTAINGKISIASGANLDNVVDVVTGLPVSDLDHAVNDLEFGNNGELYIQIGGNTNGGIPGELSGSGLMRENFFSAATLVANLGKPGFNGFISYSKVVDGDPTSGHGPNGVEVYAPGMRNPFGIVQHSNGKLYGTDNGPNKNYGDMATGCGPGQQKPDENKGDELNLIKKGQYYGHPNHKRATEDSRQCVWNGPGTTNPIVPLPSSTNGIVEFHSNHFSGQMRGNLIVSKYGGGLSRIVLSANGESVENVSSLGGSEGLSVTMAPNGNLIDARYKSNNCHYWKPNDPSNGVLAIKTVFPRRGGLSGGSKLTIYGVEFSGGAPTVTVGGKNCAGAVIVNSQKITCTLPGGAVGQVDVKVSVGGQSDTFVQGYSYIKGTP